MNNFFSLVYKNIGIKLSLAIAVLFSFILILILLRISGKNKQIKRDEMKDYLNNLKLEKEKRNPQEKMLVLDKRAKAFFQAKTHSNIEISYNLLAEKLREQKQEHSSIDFCEKMNYLLYSGKKITKKDVKDLENHFERIKRRYEKLKSMEDLKEEKKKHKRKALKKAKKNFKETFRENLGKIMIMAKEKVR